METKTILITGAPGWLGTRFVELHSKSGNDIRCLVLKGMDTSYLKELGVEIVKGDLTNRSSLNEAVDDVDTVFHLAGIIHPNLFNINDLFKVNTIGTQNLLEASIRGDPNKFIYISSNSAVGCNIDKNVLMNEYTYQRPYMAYGRSKFLAEKLVNSAFIQGKIDTVILRPCWFYGPGQPDRQTRLMEMIQNGKALLIGNGDNLRSMTYIDNLCEALTLVERNNQVVGETYWIADETPYTTLEIYETIASILGKDLETINIPSFLADFATLGDAILQKLGIYLQMVHIAGEMNKNIACSVKKAQKDFGYAPSVSLKKGMETSIKWAKENGQISMKDR
jgi:nucleoside-diphosphate-sugar epimerase